MPRRIYSNFSGGKNTNAGAQASPIIVDNGDLEALLFAQNSTNWEMSEAGLLKYPGNDAVLASALSGNPTITALTDFNGTLMAGAGTKFYTVSGDTPTEIDASLTSGAFWQSTEWDDGAGTEIVIHMNGADAPIVWNGAASANMTVNDPQGIWDNATPQGAAVFRNNIFYWGDPTYPNRIYKARPGTYNDFDTSFNDADAFDVEAGFGGPLTGLKSLTDDFLVIYKEQVIRRLSGTGPFSSGVDEIQIRHVTDAFGCIAPRTLCGNDIEHYFFSKDGLRRLKPIESYGDIDPNQPSYPIQDEINALNFNAIGDACAVYDPINRHIVLSVPTGASSTNNKIYHYDVVTGGIDPRGDDDITAASLVIFNRKVYHGDYSGQIFTWGASNGYNGEDITAEWESKWIAHHGIGTLKRYRELHFFSEADGAGDIIVQWSVMKRGLERTGSKTETIAGGDSLWGTAVWGESLWASGTQAAFKIKNPGRGNAIKLKFKNISSSQRPKIRQVDIDYDVFGTALG